MATVSPPAGHFDSSSGHSCDPWWTSGQVPFKMAWLAPSCVAHVWFMGSTYFCPTVSESYGCFQSASSVFTLWRIATSFRIIFPTGAPGSKAKLQRTQVMSSQESLTIHHSCPLAASKPKGPPYLLWGEREPSSCWAGHTSGAPVEPPLLNHMVTQRSPSSPGSQLLSRWSPRICQSWSLLSLWSECPLLKSSFLLTSSNTYRISWRAKPHLTGF